MTKSIKIDIDNIYQIDNMSDKNRITTVLHAKMKNIIYTASTQILSLLILIIPNKNSNKLLCRFQKILHFLRAGGMHPVLSIADVNLN